MNTITRKNFTNQIVNEKPIFKNTKTEISFQKVFERLNLIQNSILDVLELLKKITLIFNPILENEQDPDINHCKTKMKNNQLKVSIDFLIKQYLENKIIIYPFGKMVIPFELEFKNTKLFIGQDKFIIGNISKVNHFYVCEFELKNKENFSKIFITSEFEFID
jgi:hypothetical protein